MKVNGMLLIELLKQLLGFSLYNSLYKSDKERSSHTNPYKGLYVNLSFFTKFTF